MSSIFKNVMKSRRKRNKTRSTKPVNTSVAESKPSNTDKASSCYRHDHYATKKSRPQQQTLILSRTNDNVDERRQSLHGHYPNRHRSLSSECCNPEKEIDDDIFSARSDEANYATPKALHGKRHFLKSRKRRSKHDTEHMTNTGSITPETVASGGFTPNASSSAHYRRQSLDDHHTRRSRSMSFDESPLFSRNKIHGDNHRESTSYTTTLNDFHDRQNISKTSRHKSKDRSDHKTNTCSNTRDTVAPVNFGSKKTANRRIRRVSSSSSEDKSLTGGETDFHATKPIPVRLRFTHKHTDDHHQMITKNPFLATKDRIGLRTGKRSSGNTKTVIMNGDIVVCNSYNRKSSNDTVTITSSASSKSKAKARRRETERSARAASALDDKGNDLFEKGYFDKAMACYTKALKLKRRTFAHLVAETDDIEDELILRDDAGNLADPQALVSMATSINNIGYLRQRSGDATPEETMAAYKKSLRIKRRMLGNDSLSVGKTLNNIGSVHYLKRDADRALSAYEEALEIMKANLGDKHPDVATVMSNIGDVYLLKDNKETSIKYYRLALVIRWEAFGEKSPRVVRLLEKISNLEIGDMTYNMTNQKTHTAWGDDVGSETMVGSDFQPISEGLKLLQEQVKKDIDEVDQMERNAAVELLKDKIIIFRGMRDAWNGNGSGPELLDNDSASVQTAMSRLSCR